MAASYARNNRYQREQRFTVISWIVLVAAGALLAAVHSWSSEHGESSDDEAAPLIESPPTLDAWLDQSMPSINGVVIARNNIAAAASRHDIAATGAACQSATDTVTTLRLHMPSPEAALNQSLQQAISDYTLGLPDCISASRTLHGESMQRAANYISSGDAAMQVALDIVQDDPASSTSPLNVLIV